ncbi:unnamed protein product [Eruca vesicaria subsp. sativa]|uniref:Uncharacterized protein n=1 Tax=Eruca vesicaria subsp. sativa TaxID=29727 RepID=A0ABC8K5E7_ERUVS|nr:unnamed protein product [Eruca vesicaria subsp. sativa]
MSQILALSYAISVFILGSVTLAHWVSHRGDKNAHRNFLNGIVRCSFGLLGLVLCGAYKHYSVDDDDANNDHHDHGSGTSNDHVIINITELPNGDPSMAPSASDQSPSLISTLGNLRTTSNVSFVSPSSPAETKSRFYRAVNMGFTPNASTRGLSRRVSLFHLF